MKFFVLIVLLLALFYGCEGGGPGSITQDTHTGTDGVVMDFLQNAPPSELFAPYKTDEAFPFRVAVKAQNKGAYDVKDGWITLTVEQDYLALDTFKTSFSLDGKSTFNPSGDSDLYVFSGYTKKFKESQSEKYVSNMLATTCYKYRTELRQDVCIDTDLLGTQGKKKVCEMKEASLSGQGAPVAVTKVTPRMYPEGDKEKIAFVKPQYIIEIHNAGDGEVVNPDSDMAAVCSSELVSTRNSDDFRKTWNYVSVSASLSGKDLDCSPKYLKLSGKDDIVRCTIKEEDKVDAGTPTYNAILVVNVDYGYTTTISKQVTITRQINY